VATIYGGGAPFYRGQVMGKRAVQGEESMADSGRCLNVSVS
jgi:hypothetical protein